VIVDGKKVGSTSVATTYTTYSFNATLTPNVAHDIQIQYINDTVISGQDRNLYLRSITTNGLVTLATSAYEVYHSAVGGGPGNIASSGNMYWNGTAEFSLPAALFPSLAPALKVAKRTAVLKSSQTPSIQATPAPEMADHSVYGVLIAMQKGIWTLRTRTGVLTVDSREALKTYHSVVPTIGGALLVRGQYDGAGVLHATSVLRAKNMVTLWGKDS
jgi:hypothetical protein